eukprot:16435053-Heterocapsa_arctica.AAC.1
MSTRGEHKFSHLINARHDVKLTTVDRAKGLRGALARTSWCESSTHSEHDAEVLRMQVGQRDDRCSRTAHQ